MLCSELPALPPQSSYEPGQWGYWSDEDSSDATPLNGPGTGALLPPPSPPSVGNGSADVFSSARPSASLLALGREQTSPLTLSSGLEGNSAEPREPRGRALQRDLDRLEAFVYRPADPLGEIAPGGRSVSGLASCPVDDAPGVDSTLLDKVISVDDSLGHGCQSKPAREPPCEAVRVGGWIGDGLRIPSPPSRREGGPDAAPGPSMLTPTVTKPSRLLQTTPTLPLRLCSPPPLSLSPSSCLSPPLSLSPVLL